ncbi:MAG: ABC transporter substrate-binding protein [Candidatus Omnitrophota bacterium]
MIRTRSRSLAGLLIVLMIFLFSGTTSAEESSLKKISFIPLWKAQAQFAGYYVAYDKGIFRKYGLDVTILEGGPDHPPIEQLKDKKADFGISWLSSAIQWRSRGVKLVNIGQVSQRSALLLVAKKSSGILKPGDMQGKKVSLWEGDLQLQPKAFFRKYKLNPEIIPQSYTVNLFLMGGVDVVSAMWYNEYKTILNSGLDPDELTAFFLSDHGLNFPEDGIYALEETVEKDPLAAAAFVKACLEGWAYAFEHPDEALDIVLKYMRQAHVPANRLHQQWMLSRMKDLICPPDTGGRPGELNKDDYERVVKELINNDLIEAAPGFKEFYQTFYKQ